jgi:hypothetical protein
MVIMLFTREERELIISGLGMRKNYIETHDALMSAQDAENMGLEVKVYALNQEQHELIIKLYNLIKRFSGE